ncbi:hypothetical protein LTR08_005991 [Meristemomyces frigidus]|nr:hypothetical protein LTR08_005991 [Meristemomyces frigidus]
MVSTVAVSPLPSRRPDTWEDRAHHLKDGQGFTNPWPSFKQHGFGLAFKLRFGSNPQKKFVPVPQGLDGARSDELIKIRTPPDWGASNQDRLRATWLGHASFLMETPAAPSAERGVRILCDPVFSERTSPSQLVGPKRYSPTPCSLDDLPDVDIVCISHNHYDHLDYTTIQHIYTKRKGHVHFFVTLGVRQWFIQHICQPDEVTEVDWWDSYDVDVDGVGSVKLTCCPAQHASGRSMFDQGSTLWASYAFEGGGKKLFFAGDTAYQSPESPSPCPAFVQIGNTLGPFDLATLPIGLMTPQSFMGSVHATPEQSLNIHKEIKSRLSIGMHYGTVRGGISAHYEDVRDPSRRWRAAAEKEGLWSGGGVEGGGKSVDTSKAGVGLLDIGETVAV